MKGQRANIADALGALQDAYDDLLARLMCEPSWNALQQLQLRAQSGEASQSSADADMQQRLTAALDAEIPEWRQLEALTAAIAALKATGGAGATGEVKRGGSEVAGGRSGAAGVAMDRPVVPLSEKIVARNRSLTESLGALQKLDAGGQADRAEPKGRAGAPPELSEDVSAILKKIKSIAPARKGGSSPRAAAGRSGAGNAVGAPDAAKGGAPAAEAGRVAGRGLQAGRQDGPLAGAVRSPASDGQRDAKAPASTSPAPAAGKAPVEREAQKVISLRETLENVLERPVQTRATPRPARQETSARGMHVRPISEGPLGAPGAAAGPAPTVEVSDEAEVEIIALEPGHGVERDGKVAAGGAARAGVASAGVTAAVPRDQGGGNDGARGGGVDRDAYAGYHGHVDEAAVDIVPLDEPVADPAGDATTDAPSDEAPAQVAPGKKPPRSSGKE